MPIASPSQGKRWAYHRLIFYGIVKLKEIDHYKSLFINILEIPNAPQCAVQRNHDHIGCDSQLKHSCAKRTFRAVLVVGMPTATANI